MIKVLYILTSHMKLIIKVNTSNYSMATLIMNSTVKIKYFIMEANIKDEELFH